MKIPPKSDGNSDRIEQIVAYLDGELSAEESAQVEQQLASDEHYRQELQSMDRAWSALDLLPAASADDNFSKTTMELVVQDARREVEQRTLALPVQRRKRSLTNALMLGTCALLGMLVFRMVWHNPNRQLLADLPVIQYIDLYSQFKKASFLENIHQELGNSSWAPEVESQTLESQLQEFQLVSSADTQESWLSRQTPEEKASLRAKFNRFQGLSSTEQQRRRGLHEQIRSIGDERVLLTLMQYQQWIRQLSPTEQYELHQHTSPQDRAKQVARMIEEQRRRVALELSEEQLGELFTTVRRHAKREARSQWEKMPKREQRAWENLGPEQVQGWIRNQMKQSDLQELLKDLSAILPSAAREQLHAMSREERHGQMWNWLRQAWMLERPHGKRGEVSQEQLEAFFSKDLLAAAQEKLLALPREEMLQQLKRMYRGFSHPSDALGFWAEGHRPPPPGFGPPRDGGRRRGEGGPPGRRMRDGRGDPPPFGPPPPDDDRPRGRRRPFEKRAGPPPE